MGYVEKFIGRKLDSVNIIGGGGNWMSGAKYLPTCWAGNPQGQKPANVECARAAFLAQLGWGDHIRHIPGLIQ